MSAAGEDNQSTIADVDDDRLIIEDQRIRLPVIVAPRLLRRKARFVIGGSIHLAGDQDGVVEQETWLVLLDDRKSGALERGPTGGRNLARLIVAYTNAASLPEVRVEQDGKLIVPIRRTRPSRPPVWSKCPWLHTIASISRGSISSRSMLASMPSGLTPVSNKKRCVRSPFVTVSRSDSPCSAINWSGTRPSIIVALGSVLLGAVAGEI